jgi:hypothetical protein
MTNQKRNTLNSIGTAIIIAFLLLLVSSFSDKSSKQTCPSQYALSSEFHSDKAVIADAVPLPLVQKFVLPLLFNDNQNSFSTNSKITRSFIILQKTRLSIKPLIPCRFYYHLFSNDAEDLPDIV